MLSLQKVPFSRKSANNSLISRPCFFIFGFFAVRSLIKNQSFFAAKSISLKNTQNRQLYGRLSSYCSMVFSKNGISSARSKLQKDIYSGYIENPRERAA
jgi:hypothetical protein